MDEKSQNNSEKKDLRPSEEGRDYYFENGNMVLTEYFLKERGYCCESGCRHCPYGFKDKN